MGHARLARRSSTEVRVIDFVHLLWTVSGTGVLLREGREHELPEDHVGLYMPGMRHRLSAGGTAWEYRWITLDGPSAAEIIRGFGFDGPPFRAGACPCGRFDELEELIGRVGPVGEREAAARAFELLTHIANRVEIPPPDDRDELLVRNVLEKMRESVHDAAVGISQIAAAVGADRSVMTRKFKSKLGVPPKEYLDALRLQRVLALLRDRSLSIVEISRRAGFSSPNYMAKFFHKRMGKSPSEFREAAHM